VVVATRNPYDIASLPQVRTYLASYSWTRPAMNAVARVLVRERAPVGTLPVRIPAADDPATTLYPYGFGLGYGG
jgi:beta-N-acetylhexosaminidase